MKTGTVKAAVAGLIGVLWFTDVTYAQQVTSDAQRGRHQRIVVVSIPDRQLAVLEDGRVLRTFPVSVGATASPSPVGEFEIVSHVAHPTYTHNGAVIPSGPNNPLGPRWMGLSVKGYGIHGTNQPRSIGKAASHGCIRLSNHDIVDLYPLLAVGDKVEIRAVRDEQTARLFRGEDNVAMLEARYTAPATHSRIR